MNSLKRWKECYEEAYGKYKVPRNVQKLILQRTMLSKRLREVINKVNDYCDSIGLDVFHPLYDEAVLNTDIRIFCEEDAGGFSTLKAIEKVLAERSENGTKTSN